MADTTYGVINQRTAAWATKEMLSHAEPILVLSKFGQSKPLPKNKADTVKFRRPNPFPISLTPLTEGVTPVAQALTYTDVPATINQYGAVVKITDKVEDLAEDPVLKDASMLSGEQAAETTEMVIWGEIKGGTYAIYDIPGTHTSRSQVDAPVSLSTVRAAVKALKKNRGKPINRILDGSVKIGTKPVEGGYIALGHTDLEGDIRSLPGFISVAQYGGRIPLCTEEIGSVENVRFVLSPLLEPFASAGGLASNNNTITTNGTNADVYPLIVIAKEAYGLVPLKGPKAIQPTVLNPGTPSKSDPLGQVGYVGWKCYFTAKILNQAWIQRIEVAASV